MPRRPKKSNASLFSDLVAIAALLPWWISVPLGIASYFVFHDMYTHAIPPTSAGGVEGLQGVFLGQLKYMAIAIGQYAVPAIFAIGAVIAASRALQRARLMRMAYQAGIDGIRRMDWKAFEELVAEGFRYRGYCAAVTGGGGADGGVDVVLSKGQQRILVQCKHYRSTNVGVGIVRELAGVVAAYRATAGIVVTSGEYSESAKEFGKTANIELIDGAGLVNLINEGMSSRKERNEANSARTSRTGQQEIFSIEAAAFSAPPDNCDSSDQNKCPKCFAPMVLRTATMGSGAGDKFWGCSRFPKCRATKPVQA